MAVLISDKINFKKKGSISTDKEGHFLIIKKVSLPGRYNNPE